MAWKTFTFFTLLALLFLTAVPLHTAKSRGSFSETISPEALGFFNRPEKLSHLHFYFHDIVSGPNRTAVRVAEGPTTNDSATLFGLVAMADDPLTAGPEQSSKLVGRAQGMYASAAMSELGLLMILNFVFEAGKYNGSTLSVLGRNAVFSGVRELPIVGGSGLFRFARGYAEAKTHKVDIETGNAVVQYDVYVFHY
ncbi:hypothetical protein Nepgr_010055 [Nepenthes gracilis]|uniref:Dirigent protein n=1 Tax=Nepenthes gracilis TaxID=150966 RepID=A0AAD3SCH4_NEPGR|nr:hypothetical protein Nepgr_010055 [Nepenthes gracilis]